LKNGLEHASHENIIKCLIFRIFDELTKMFANKVADSPKIKAQRC